MIRYRYITFNGVYTRRERVEKQKRVRMETGPTGKNVASSYMLLKEHDEGVHGPVYTDGEPLEKVEVTTTREARVGQPK